MKDFLVEFMKVYPHIPSQALWRAIEAELYDDQQFEQPILDLGCGDGFFASILFKNKCKDIYGCDVCEEYTAIAKSHGIYKSVIVSDARYLPYKDNLFATVLSNCVLEHITEDEKVLREVFRILKTGGRLIFTAPSEKFVENLKIQSEGYVKNLQKRLGMFHYRSPLEWEKLLQKCALTLEEFRYHIPKPVQQLWEVLTQFFIKKVMGRELFRLLGSRKMGIKFVIQLCFPIIFGRYLRKWYLMGTIDNGEGGSLFIVARKLKNLQ